jgi:hypothetical protein
MELRRHPERVEWDRGATAALSLVACRQSGLANSVMGWNYLTGSFLRSYEPSRMSLRLRFGGGRPAEAQLLVSAFDAQTADAIAAEFCASVEAATPWLEFTGPIAVDKSMSAQADQWALTATAPVDAMALTSSVLKTLATLSHEVDITITAHSLDSSDPLDTHVNLSVVASGANAAHALRLLAAETPGAVGLMPVPLRGEAPVCRLPLMMAGGLFSLPARLYGLWPEERPEPAASVVRDMVDSTTPHRVVFGGSGLGKSVFLTHVADALLRRSERVAVVCGCGCRPKAHAH